MKNYVYLFIFFLSSIKIYGQGLPCQSFGITIQDSSNYEYLTLNADNMFPNFWENTVILYEWQVYGLQIYETGYDSTITIQNYNDVIFSWLYVDILDTLTNIHEMCYVADTLIWDDHWIHGDYEIEDYDTTIVDEFVPIYDLNYDNVDEYEYVIVNNDFYDLSGRRYNSYESIPLGQSYIWNRKVYVKTSYTHNP